MSEDKLSLVAKVSKKDASSVKLEITRQGGGEMAIGRNRNGNVTLDLSELVGKTNPSWDYRSGGAIEIEYVELKVPPEEFHRKALRLPGWPEPPKCEARFGPPVVAGKPSRIDVHLQGFSFRQDVEAALPITIRLDNQDCTVHSSADGSSDVRLSFQSEPPQIDYFRATPSIVPVGSSTTLSWSCPNAKSCTLYVGDTPETVDAEGSKRIPINDVAITSFRLKAQADGGGTAITEPLRVKALETNEWLFGAGWEGARLARLVVDSDGRTLYAVVVPSSDNAQPELWSSPDGFSVWKKNEGAIPLEMATSPAVCFGFGKEGAGHLVFLGGSRIDRRPQQVSNRVYRLTPAGKNVDEHVAEWQPRLGHACVVAVNRLGHQSIWIMGGVDESLNPLNDVWMWDGNDRTDGTRWTQCVAADALWSPRCMLSATTRGSELWIGGGFETPAGKPYLDIYVSDSRGDKLKWERPRTRDGSKNVRQSIVSQPSYNAATMIALDDTVYFLGNCGDRSRMDFQSVTGESSTPMLLKKDYAKPTLPPFKTQGGRSSLLPSLLDVVSFNGCLWMVAQAYDQGGRWQSSSLSYWAPPPSAS